MSEFTVAAALHNLRSRLAKTSESAGLDAQVLLARAVGQSRSWILAHPSAALAPDQMAHLEKSLACLESGTPLPYVLGSWEFFGLKFSLTPDVLIPRPETELLVEHAIAWLCAHPKQRCAADVGTGSGCIAVALAKAVADLHVIATDISAAALDVAQANARRHNVAERFTFLQADLLTPLDGTPLLASGLDLIVANLPYIPSDTLATLDVHKREPSLALDGGPDGLSAIRRLLGQAEPFLAHEGLMLLEIEANQGREALRLARQAFPAARIVILPDLAGRDRLLRIATAPDAR